MWLDLRDHQWKKGQRDDERYLSLSRGFEA
jgi:hypothetical protein